MYRRDLPGQFRFQSDTDDSDGVLIGVVCTYDSPYPLPGFPGYREEVVRGAFDASLQEQPVVAVYLQHGHLRGNAPIGHATPCEGPDGVLTLRATLYVEDSADARVAYRAAKSGALREWSVGMFYRDQKSGDIELDHREKLVRVRHASLKEVSMVLKGANPGTDTLDVRSAFPDESTEDPEPIRLTTRSDEELAQFLYDLYK